MVGLLGCGVRIYAHATNEVYGRFGGIVGGCVLPMYFLGGMDTIMMPMISVCMVVLGVVCHHDLPDQLDTR